MAIHVGSIQNIAPDGPEDGGARQPPPSVAPRPSSASMIMDIIDTTIIGFMDLFVDPLKRIGKLVSDSQTE